MTHYLGSKSQNQTKRTLGDRVSLPTTSLRPTPAHLPAHRFLRFGPIFLVCCPPREQMTGTPHPFLTQREHGKDTAELGFLSLHSTSWKSLPTSHREARQWCDRVTICTGSQATPASELRASPDRQSVHTHSPAPGCVPSGSEGKHAGVHQTPRRPSGADRRAASRPTGGV